MQNNILFQKRSQEQMKRSVCVCYTVYSYITFYNFIILSWVALIFMLYFFSVVPPSQMGK